MPGAVSVSLRGGKRKSRAGVCEAVRADGGGRGVGTGRSGETLRADGGGRGVGTGRSGLGLVVEHLVFANRGYEEHLVFEGYGGGSPSVRSSLYD